MNGEFGNKNIPAAETLKTREVFTGDSDVIGPLDETEFLEALPLMCAILTVSAKGKKVAGMAHFSLGLYQEGATELARQLAQKLAPYNIGLRDTSMRVIQGDEMQWEEMTHALAAYGVAMPEPEGMPFGYQGVRVNKNTGEVTFFATAG